MPSAQRIRLLIKKKRAPQARAFGRAMTREEQIEFITRPVWMGWPTTPDQSGRRGPKSKKTQYDFAFERRRDLYRRNVKLPEISVSGVKARRATGDLTRDYIATIAICEFPAALNQADLVRRIRRCMADNSNDPQYDDTTIRRALRELRIRK